VLLAAGVSPLKGDRGPSGVADNDRRSEMLAYDYPLLGVLWSMFVFFLWVTWFVLLFKVIVDIFRSHDLSGLGKTAWLVFAIVLPFLGVFAYVVARGDGMSEREVARAQSQQQAFDSYVRETAHNGGSADQLTKLANLRQQGVITDAEFENEKAKVLAG
jgi:putative oligomerization/nucleic acid binding protein/phospholipase D-like protein